jgi:hypothetical protein
MSPGRHRSDHEPVKGRRDRVKASGGAAVVGGAQAVPGRWRRAALAVLAVVSIGSSAGCTSGDATSPVTTRSLTVATFPPAVAAATPGTIPPPTGYADRIAIVANVPFTGTLAAFDLYRPLALTDAPALVVLFPGRASDKSLFGPVAAALAATGVVVAVPNYRAPLDRPATEVRCAVGAIEDFVARRVGEPDRIVLAGFAFGAVVAVGEGLGGPWARSEVDTGDCPAPAPSRPVHAVVGIAGDYDRYGGPQGPPATSTWNPFTQLDTSKVPVTLLQGTPDALDLPPEVALGFADALETAGHPYRLLQADLPNLALAGLTVDPATGQLVALDTGDDAGIERTVAEIGAALG